MRLSDGGIVDRRNRERKDLARLGEELSLVTEEGSIAAEIERFRERDGGKRALEHLAKVDAERETWTFDDVGLDSGTFGELVAAGIVEKVDDGTYRVADPAVLESVLSGESVDSGRRSRPVADGFDITVPRWGRPRAILAVAGSLLVLVVMRVIGYTSVMRDGLVVSPANDPYYYRYWMEHLLASGTGISDVSTVIDMDPRMADRRPFTHAANWWIAEVLGGDQWAAEFVAAWLPVVAAVVLGVVIYLTAVVLTDDVRVGAAAVLMLALAPVHAVFMGIGFLEHRLHQYLWMGVTILALVWLAVDQTERVRANADGRAAIFEHLMQPWTWVAAVTVGIALTITNLAWGGGPLHLLAFAGYFALKVAMDVRSELSPVLANLPILVGVGLAAVLSRTLYVRWGWHESFVAYAPALILAGIFALLVVGEGWRLIKLPTKGLVAVEGLLALATFEVFRRRRPEEYAWLRERADDLFFREGATETASLFTTELAIIFGPITQLGLSFYFALAVILWASWLCYQRYEPAWLLLVSYSAIWLVFAAFQVRFAAQFMIALAVPAGLGVVYLLSAVDLCRVPRPFREEDSARRGWSDGDDEAVFEFPSDVSKTATVIAVLALISVFSLIFIPSFIGQVVYDDAEVEAMEAVTEYVDRVDGHHADFVLNDWGRNRMFNYFVSGESHSYSYAQSNFNEFRFGSDPDGWYEQFDGRVGFVVFDDVGSSGVADSSQATLHEGLKTGAVGSAHYRAIYLSDDETVSAFAVVPGATINASHEANSTVTVSTDVTVSGNDIEYSRTVQAGADGVLEVTVPYPGTYEIDGVEVAVTEEDVTTGNEIVVD